MRACVDPSPVIDGRRANCNLASLGLQRSKPATTPLHGGMGTAFASPAAAAPAPASFPHYAIQQGLPYYVYGFSPYTAEYNYATSDHQSHYNMYGGAATQYPLYGGAATGVAAGTTGYYPYFQFGQGGAAAAYPHQGQGYGMQYPQMLQYSAMTTTAGVTGFPSSLLHGAPVSLAMSPTAQAGLFRGVVP
ncbi:hypothetical protein B296_00031175 [Ensete ventricosum]|uniref:Uncharacterized protein n=1 Tax=Ensete ventricosum TaxID=4639 RepID=A0A426XKS4_ENSVE|nr:hypothetical protein B296_00031175 [Ensete ventricosum]